MKIKVKLPELEQRDTGLFDVAAGVKLGSPELRESGTFPKIVGYAAVFNVLSEPLFMGVREKIRPGAFARALSEGQDVRGLVDHKPAMILGRTKAGTLRLSEDQHGLRYEIDPPDTQLGRDTIVSLRRKDLDQSSFGFRVKEEEYNIKDDVVTRELLDVDLFDVSVVTYPAYTQTSVAVRSLWPETDERVATAAAETWFRHIKSVLAPPKLLHAYERRLRLRRLDAIGKEITNVGEETRAAKEIQKIMFKRSKWDATRAKRWLGEHNFSADKMDTSANYFHFRQFEQGQCKEGTYETLADNMPDGILMVACEKVAAS